MPDLSNREIRELIDPHCDSFEALWHGGDRPSLQELAKGVPAEVQSALFSELLAIELEFRSQTGENPKISDYEKQYADFADEIRQGFQDHSSWQETNLQSSLRSDADEIGLKTEPFLASTTDTAEAARSAAQQPLPDQIGRYRVERLLGRGGMGEVLLAEDTVLNRPVAIKLPVFSEHNRDELIARFYREAQAMAKVRHPNLCPIYEIGEINGRPFLAMAFVDGESLAEKLQTEQPMPADEAAKIVRTLATAIAAAHEGGVIHRDLKPGNVMIDRKGVPLVTDFGLARNDEPDDARISSTGVPIGTPAYMSPEQVAGDAEAIGPVTDVYALGVILYELLTGKRPFDGKGLAVLGQITSGSRPEPPSAIANVNPRLESICLKAMSHDPTERFQTAEELARALKTGGDQPEPANETRPSRRTITAVAVCLLLLPILLIASELLIKTPTGEVIVTAAEGSDVRIEVLNGGKVVGVLGPENEWRLDVEAGQYKVAMLSPDYAITMEDDTVVVSKNGVAEVTVQRRQTGHAVPGGNNALAFDGVDNYVYVPGVDRPEDGEMTLEAWVKPKSYQKASTVIARVHGPALLQLGRSNDYYFAMDGRAALPHARNLRGANFAPRYEIDGWYHVAVVSDKATVSLFVGGVLCWTLPKDQPPDPGSADGLYIGAHPARDQVRYFFEGTIDELRVSSSSRYTDGFQPTRRFEADDNAVALFHFDEGSGTQLMDSSGHNHHGTIFGAKWTSVEADAETKAPEVPPTAKKTFSTQVQHSGTGFRTRGILMDFDQDGDLDAFIANYDAPDSVWWNDGSGEFTDSGQKIANSKSVGIAFGDLDGDGDLDAFVPNVGAQPNLVYVNEAVGIFRDSGQKLGASSSKAAVLQDFDQDGDLDAFVANYSEGFENRLYLNDGSGVFTDSGKTFGDTRSYFLAQGDFDGDGDDDVFVANGREESPNQIYWSDPEGLLVDSGQSLGTGWSLGCAAGDVDNDGDLDVVVANRKINKVWLNDGTGKFSVSEFDFEEQDSWHVALGDVDNDGDLDAFVSNLGANSLWFNDGSGKFESPEYYHSDNSHYAELQDLDNDGDLDAFVVNQDGPVRLLFNTRLAK